MAKQQEETKKVETVNALNQQDLIMQEMFNNETDTSWEWIQDDYMQCLCSYLKVEGVAQSSGIKPELVVNIVAMNGKILPKPQRYRAADPAIKSEDGMLPKANAKGQFMLDIRFGKLSADAKSNNNARSTNNPFMQQQNANLNKNDKRIVGFKTPDLYKFDKDGKSIVGLTQDVNMLEEAVFNNRGLLNKVARRKSSYQNNMQAASFAAPTFNTPMTASTPTIATPRQAATVDIDLDSMLNAAG